MTIDGAVAALGRGEIIGLPTDTLYGLAVDPFREEAIEAMYDLKGRKNKKPLALLVADIEQAMRVAELTDRALELADRHWPGGLTMVLNRLGSVPDWIGDAKARTVGVRCPDHPAALALLRRTGPLAVTSANLSGRHSAVDHVEAKDQFGDTVGYYVEGTAPGGQASTVLDLTLPSPLILRAGPVKGA
ncbi:Threonylcarbamoyl-AMP synthase [hydrothermal vent metagenome]|uniref:L-threonylcarbamoyladenylate synthase n=1 Tax=hydrothermal vent metagenome TaxID=652676 RepID=A0A3B0T191_9ZZZZ